MNAYELILLIAHPHVKLHQKNWRVADQRSARDIKNLPRRRTTWRNSCQETHHTQVNLFFQLIPLRAITNSRQFYGSTGRVDPKCGSIVKHARRGTRRKKSIIAAASPISQCNSRAKNCRGHVAEAQFNLAVYGAYLEPRVPDLLS